MGRALRQRWNFFLLPQSAAATALRAMNPAMNIQILLPVPLTVVRPPIASGHGGDYGLVVQGGASLSPCYLRVISLPDDFCL